MMRTRCSFPIPTELYSNMADEYGGSAAGPQSFGEDIKEEFMKKHQLLSDENNDN